MIYVGSAESEEYDQILDSVFVGPIPEGKHMFVFEVSPSISPVASNNTVHIRQIPRMCPEYQKTTL